MVSIHHILWYNTISLKEDRTSSMLTFFNKSLNQCAWKNCFLLKTKDLHSTRTCLTCRACDMSSSRFKIWYYTQFGGEATVLVHWEVRNSSLWPLFLGPIRPRIVVPVRDLGESSLRNSESYPKVLAGYLF